METYRDKLEAAERQAFDLAIWRQRLIDSRSARMKWDADYAEADQILSNNISLYDGNNDLAEYTDNVFHTNWLLKLCIWMESYIQSADVYADLKSHSGSDNTYPDRLTLEIELNDLMSKFEIVRDWSTMVVPKRIRYGFGASYSGWNGMAIDPYWRNGKPNFISLDPRRVWADPSAGDRNFRNRRWVWCKYEIDVEDAKRLFPDHADAITETYTKYQEGDADNRKDVFDVYLCQYTKKEIHRMVDIEIYVDERREIKQVLLSQLQDYLEENPDQVYPENMRVLDSGDPDNPGYDAEISCCYQFKYSPDIEVQLSEVEYVGDRDQFQFWCYHPIAGDIYPRGTAYMLSKEQRIKTILLTRAVIDALQNGRKIPVLEEGALTNEDDFVSSHNDLDFVGKVSEEWRMNHMGQDAVKFYDIQTNPAVTSFLDQLLRSEMQQFSGGTDSMMGQAQYAGMSAAQTGLLQASGATYTKSDELSYRDYVRDVQESYLRQIAEFKTYEHTIEGVNEAGKAQTVLVNPSNMSDWDWERYFCVPIIENNPEMIKQLKENRALQLKGIGAMGTVRMLQELGYNNAEQIAAEAQEEAGIMQIIQILQENPELMQMVTDMANKSASNAKGNSQEV